jgi:hypothetical protein
MKTSTRRPCTRTLATPDPDAGATLTDITVDRVRWCAACSKRLAAGERALVAGRPGTHDFDVLYCTRACRTDFAKAVV